MCIWLRFIIISNTDRGPFHFIFPNKNVFSRCIEAFSEATRATILANFNEIGSHDIHNALITATEKLRSVQMCREGFASLYGIGTKRLRLVTACVTEETTPKDKRCMHNDKPSI